MSDNIYSATTHQTKVKHNSGASNSFRVMLRRGFVGVNNIWYSGKDWDDIVAAVEALRQRARDLDDANHPPPTRPDPIEPDYVFEDQKPPE